MGILTLWVSQPASMTLWINQMCVQLGKNQSNACNSQLFTNPMDEHSLIVLCIHMLKKSKVSRKIKNDSHCDEIQNTKALNCRVCLQVTCYWYVVFKNFCNPLHL